MRLASLGPRTLQMELAMTLTSRLAHCACPATVARKDQIASLLERDLWLDSLQRGLRLRFLWLQRQKYNLRASGS